MKKSQTNLSKVMLDIKKYQMIDQKGVKSKAANASGVSVHTSQVQSVSSVSNSNSSATNKQINPSVHPLSQELDYEFDQFS